MKVRDGLHAFLWESMMVNNCNTYFIDGPVRVLIDPGHDAYFDHVIRKLAALDLTISDIDMVIVTHCHPDHLEGAKRFKNERAVIAMHEAEWNFIAAIPPHFLASMGFPPNEIKPNRLLTEGPLELESLSLEIYQTPGHSPGSICIYWPENKTLFSGDLIFAEGLGRVDLPGGDGKLITESILRMKALDVVRILPGHGEIVEGKAAVRRTFNDLEDIWFHYV
jgi:hydroxyacylglutathione hydrolase